MGRTRRPLAAGAAEVLCFTYHHLYGMDVAVPRYFTVYGPRQRPDMAMARLIAAACEGTPFPVYGDGRNVRDWLFVDDHARALVRVLERGTPGETYNVGGRSERRNIDVVNTISAILDEVRPRADGGSYADRITFVEDRPGHDWRYAIDCSRIEDRLGWHQEETFESGMRKTVEWYRANGEWTERVMSGRYRLERLGVARGGEDAA